VKGVADWGENKSDKYQREAAENAINFALSTIELLPSTR
jgi:hypothetical protein